MGVLENLKRMLLSDDAGIGSGALASERLAAHLSAAKQELRAYAVHAKRLKADAAKLRQEADQWRRRAEAAVAGGRDDLAREALKRSFSLERDADELERQATEAEASIKQLTDTVRQVGQRARRHQGSSVSLDAFGEFDRMSSRLETDLTAADLDAEMGDGAKELSDAVLAAKIEELEASRQASEALNRLKSEAAQRRKRTSRTTGSSSAADRRSTARRATAGAPDEAPGPDQDPELGEELDSIRQQLGGSAPGAATQSHDTTPDGSSKDRGNSGV